MLTTSPVSTTSPGLSGSARATTDFGSTQPAAGWQSGSSAHSCHPWSLWPGLAGGTCNPAPASWWALAAIVMTLTGLQPLPLYCPDPNSLTPRIAYAGAVNSVVGGITPPRR